MNTLAFHVLICFPTFVLSSSYPLQWIKRGECLDFNEGPLTKDVVPLHNQNVLKVESSDSLSDCAGSCFKFDNCSYFTYYSDNELSEDDCLLVGFNLGSPCFSLRNKCVFLMECLEFSDHCHNCSTGIRPLTEESAEDERIILFNGDVDDPMYLENESEVLSETKANNMEILSTRGTCMKKSSGLLPRIGSMGLNMANKILNCGGYTSKTSAYLTTCLSLSPDDTTKWVDFSSLRVPRAFGSGIYILGKSLIIGGYNTNDSFLDSVEVYENGNWSIKAELSLLKSKSHFCALTTSKNEVILIGGWNGGYLRDVDVLLFHSNGSLKEPWKSFPTLLTHARSNAACAETQIGWERGILVAGGYEAKNTWMGSLEFYGFDEGKWRTIESLPSLSTPRHYHGMAILNNIPTILGGCNNGALKSVETMDDADLDEDDKWSSSWRPRNDLELQLPREKFAYVKVPLSFSKLKC